MAASQFALTWISGATSHVHSRGLISGLRPAVAEHQSTLIAYNRMGSKELFDEPTEIRAVGGEVELDGPDGVDVAMTPEAAEETADRLFRASAEAAGQRRLSRNRAGLVKSD